MKKTLMLSAFLLLAACGSGNDGDDFELPAPQPPTPTPTPEPQPDGPPNARFDIGVVNLTAGQPASPLAIIVHDDSVSAFSLGKPASSGLEMLAESGDNRELLQELAQSGVVSQSSSTFPLLPMDRATFTLELNSPDTSDLRLTILTMLMNTNDAFTGINGVQLSGLSINESLTVSTVAYDSGTEANTETAATIPGPAAGGVAGGGFSVEREDRDQVTMHGGVVTADDGLAGSALSEQHRWDNPVLRISITRTQ